ncbi:MAG: tRNA guanosine(34) transglycosylase Tgt [Bacteroidetes bacterium]|jgi:queuine tRNA-ribosyltransferase|nr:tRNA guanosine(34) transglycosylase Tgt [Bacteroidota bacterium]
MNNSYFNILATDDKSPARTGVFSTGHGEIETPIFMPVGTLGGVKGVHHRDLEQDIEAQIILGNTYHLFLRPGMEVMEEAGGLHRFMHWDKPILTDSGGYQVFSLSDNRKLKEEGAYFQSHIDGSRHVFTPENVIDIQRIIGADIIMAFDECTPFPCGKKEAITSMELTHRWLQRCINQFKNTADIYGHRQFLFPIVQGSVYPDLRTQSAEFIASMELEGNAIGGLSVGEPINDMYAMLKIVNEILPDNKPRYLMGVGTPANILEAISMGTDMFDCVMPTRNGRNGMLFTADGIINIKNKKWMRDFTPIDTNGTTFVDHFSKAYLRHLVVSNEMLGAQIASVHNLGFYLKLVKTAREKIKAGIFEDWKHKMIPKLENRL